MNEGILIYCFNNREVDYARMSIISAYFAKENLKKPVSLITDQSTIDWMITAKLYEKTERIFDKIILVERPKHVNNRILHNGSNKYTAPFLNNNRYSAYELSPYEKTLLIDSDFLILNDALNEYFKIQQPVLLGERIKDIYDRKRLGYLDRFISETGIKMRWATTVLFDRSDESRIFFDLVKTIYDNYDTFGSIFRFNTLQYRNDISFSVAEHIMNGFIPTEKYYLPPILTTLDKDVLYSYDHKKLTFLIDENLQQNYFLTAIEKQNIHIMNKKSLIDQTDKLLDTL